MHFRKGLALTGAALAISAAAWTGGACGGEGGKGEDRPNVDVISGEGSVSVSGAVEGYGELLYEPATAQDLDLAIGLDLRDMRSLMAPAGQGRTVDWAKVAAIYTDGKNQVRADGSKRSLAAVAATVTPAVFPDAAAAHGRPDFIDAMVRDGLAGTGRGEGLSANGRRHLVDKGIQVLMYAKAVEGLDTAVAKMDAGDRAAAIAAVDSAWASISGARDTTTTTPNNGVLATALAREADFGFEGQVARPLEASLFAAQAAAERGDRAAFTKAVADSRGYMSTIFYLSSLRYAGLAQADARATDREGHLAEGWAFFQAVRSAVAKASPAAAQAVEEAYGRPADQPFPESLTADIYTALNTPAVLQALGVPGDFQLKDPR